MYLGFRLPQELSERVSLSLPIVLLPRVVSSPLMFRYWSDGGMGIGVPCPRQRTLGARR